MNSSLAQSVSLSPAATSLVSGETRVGFRIHATSPWLLLPRGVPSQLALDPIIAPVPNVKSWLVGVLNLRGNLVPIVDVAATCGMPNADLSTCSILVIEPGNSPLGVLCIGQPLIGIGRASTASVPSQWNSLGEFLVERMLFDHGDGYEFRFREWIACVGASLPGPSRGQSE